MFSIAMNKVKHYSRGVALTKVFLMAGICAVLLMACASGSVPAPDSMKISSEGKTRYAIVQADQVSEPEKFAVQELSKFLSRVTGASCQVVEESKHSKDAPGIYVGWTKYAAQNGIDTAKLGEEEWVVRSIGENLVITGGRPRGTLYAVYEFLEKQVGCHWLALDSEIIPSTPTLEFSKINIQGKPFMMLRDIALALNCYPMVAFTSDMTAKNRMFEIRNKSNGPFVGWDKRYEGGLNGIYRTSSPPQGCHTFAFYVNAKDWFKSHPEYFSLNSQGQRVPAYDGAGPGQLCLTNPDVRRLTLESLRKLIAIDRAEAAQKGCPPPKIYDISQNDVPDCHCKCANCQAIVAREGGESGPMIDFINAVAEDIEKDNPDIIIQTFAYNQTAPPPKNIKPRKNVMIRWCDVYGVSDLVRPLNHPYNTRNYEEITGWGKISSNLAIWDYWLSSGYYIFPTPFCIIQCIGPDIKLFADLHAKTFFTESENEGFEPGGNFIALQYWLGYKLMADPYQPVEPLIKTFMEGYYGAAGSKMNGFLEYMERRIDKDADAMMVRGAPQNLKYLDLDFFVTAEKIFGEAEALVKPGSPEELHIRKERVVVDGALLYLWPWLDRKLKADSAMPFDHEAVIRRYETEWRALSKAYYSQEKGFAKYSDAQTLREARLARLTALFRDPKLPEPFSKLPARDVADFNCLTFSPFTPGSQLFVPDKEAPGGVAATIGKSDGRGEGYHREVETSTSVGEPEAYKKPICFGVSGKAPIFLKPEDIPQDGKYHVFKIGKVNVREGTTVWALDGKQIGVNVDRLFVEDAKDSKVNEWNAYISLKIKGPAYVKGSTDANGVWMDRVLLVKPQAGEKADADYLLRQEEEKKRDALRPLLRLPPVAKGAAGDPLKVDWDKKAVNAGKWGTLMGLPSSRKVESRFAQDGEYLYVRLTEELNPESLVYDAAVFGGDDWELLFASKRGEKPYRQIGINPKGEHKEMAYGEKAWESGAKVVSATDAKSWKVCLSFPLKNLVAGGIKPGQSVYVNIMRGGKEPLAWSPTFEGSFHILDRMGEIVLE